MHVSKSNRAASKHSVCMPVNIHTDGAIGRCRRGIRGSEGVTALLIEPYSGIAESKSTECARFLGRDSRGTNGSGHIGAGTASEDQGHTVSTDAIGDNDREVRATTRDDGVGTTPEGVGDDGHIGQHLQVDGVASVIDPVAAREVISGGEGPGPRSRVGQEGISGIRQSSIGAEVDRSAKSCTPIDRQKARGASTKEDIERAAGDRQASDRKCSDCGTVTWGNRTTTHTDCGVGRLSCSGKGTTTNRDGSARVGAIEQELTVTDGCGSAVGVVTA